MDICNDILKKINNTLNEISNNNKKLNTAYESLITETNNVIFEKKNNIFFNELTNNQTKIILLKNDIEEYNDMIIHVNSEIDKEILNEQFAETENNYRKVMSVFSKISNKYKINTSQQVKNQIKLKYPNKTNEEIEEFQNNMLDNNLFKQDFMIQEHNAHSESLLRYKMNLEKLRDIRQIEKQMVELKQMFVDVHLLTIGQGEVIDDIETHIEKSNASIKKGVVQLREAEKKQRGCIIN